MPARWVESDAPEFGARAHRTTAGAAVLPAAVNRKFPAVSAGLVWHFCFYKLFVYAF